MQTQTQTTPLAWADPSEILDPAEASRTRRSPITVASFGAATLRTVIVDDGVGPRLHLEASSEDGLDVCDASALVELLYEQVEILRRATAE